MASETGSETGSDTGAAARREQAVRAAVATGLAGPDSPVVGLLDIHGIRGSAAALRAAFEEVTRRVRPFCTPSP